MVDNYGCIHARIQYVWTGHTYERRWGDFTWEGAPVARLRGDLLRDCRKGAALLPGDELPVGPFVVRVIRPDPESDQYWVRRVDEQALAGWLRMWQFRLHLWGERLGWRVILTLAIWGLAEWPKGGEIPTFDLVKRRWRRAP